MKLYDAGFGLFLVLGLILGGVGTTAEKKVKEEPVKVEAQFDQQLRD